MENAYLLGGRIVLLRSGLQYASEKFLWLTNKEKKRPVFSSSTSKDLNYITEDYSYKSKEDYL